ncbi:YhfT family protein [Anaerorhabdus sp.]|uniref:YhfT family protein n=1 Tax=Anaerorhabdus sp. TaxID=1872524 RepID=UPI002FCC7C2C
MNYVLLAAIGALAAVLANKGIAVFNDGFRPIVPQYLEGKINRKELATMSFAISFGLVIGFGIPTSIAATIILIHAILLTTDIIGTWCPDNLTGTIMSAVIGGLYGVGILVGLESIVTIFGYLPFNFLNALGSVSKFITVAFAVFPALAVAYQHGYKKGIVTGVITVLVYFLIKKFGIFSLGEFKIALSGEGMAMLAGTITMLIYATQVKNEGGDANTSLVNVFSNQVSRIRKNWILLAVMGGLIAAATSLSVVAGDPTSLALLAAGSYSEAALAAFARAIGFVPLVFTTAIVTGVYGPAGCTFVFVIGLLFINNPIVALIVGAIVMIVEILLINVFAKGMDKFPGVKDMGEHIRTSMNKVLEVTLLVGAVVAAEAMAGAVGLSGIGALFVIGCELLNKTFKKPIVELAIGPVACILFGILINILLVVNLVALVPVA